MSGVTKINIVESVEDLKELMKQQKSSLAYAKVQSLYFLKMGEVETVRHLALLMGRGERTMALPGLVGKMYSRIQSCWRVSGTNHKDTKDTKIDRSYCKLN
ncbi:hypothetical protein MTo_02269 [Microcystis aeruginosa NIES-1211]|jgi:hypothetical protein|nr:hypothetical protein B5D77_01080 [Microcystis sp. MC19]GBL14961.1 hypothetical protein MTo_02269 [Microcystis aeruginosa NIES-1211]